MNTIAVLVMVVLSFGAVAWPFLTRRTESATRARSDRPWDDLVNQRDSAYRALKELEFEHSLGNLSDEDYADLKERYRTQAAGILQRLDTAMQQATEEGGDGESPAPPPAAQCRSCREAVDPEDDYCWRCGEALHYVCGNCGETVLDEDVFCPGCGRRLEVTA